MFTTLLLKTQHDRFVSTFEVNETKNIYIYTSRFESSQSICGMSRLCARLTPCLTARGVRSWYDWSLPSERLRSVLCDQRDHLTTLGCRCEGRRLVFCSSLSTSSDMAPRLAKALSQRLWEGCGKQAMLALYNPFVVALAAGALEEASFQSYIAQDVFFLRAFSKAYVMSSSFVGVGKEMGYGSVFSEFVW